MNFTTNEKTGVSEGFCLIKTCDKKQTARGVPYLDLVLTDQSGEISAKLWDYKEEAQGSFAANDLVKVRGRIDVYNGADQLRIDRIRQVVPSDNVEMSDYVPSAAYDGAWMLSEIRSLVAAFENADLKELVTELLNEYEEQLLYWPAPLSCTTRSGEDCCAIRFPSCGSHRACVPYTHLSTRSSCSPARSCMILQKLRSLPSAAPALPVDTPRREC